MTWGRGAFWTLVVLLLTPALSLTVLRVSDPRQSLLIRVQAVHPEQPTHPVTWRADHDELFALARSEHPDLIVGDFNATLDQAPIRRLEDQGYRSATELANQGWQPTWPANGLYRALHLVPMPPLVQIDQVMLGPGLTATDTTTVAVDGTDHRGLLAALATAASE